MKIFSDEIEILFKKLKKNEKFAFSKFADGEWNAIRGFASSPGNGEWQINQETEFSRQLLIDSFQYKDPGYFVGISCPCCQGANHFKMKEFSGQAEENLTFANLFVNSNYKFFIENFLTYFARHNKIVLVANSNSKNRLQNLPFTTKYFYGVGYNAWVTNLDVVEEIQNKDYSDALVLFSCGPLGNILAHKLWEKNKTNTYIDIGSTVDRWLDNDIFNKRLYATGTQNMDKQVCVWGIKC